MRSFVLIALCFFFLSCQSVERKRSPSSVLPADELLDPKFEEFEGGSYQAEKAVHQELVKTATELMSKMVAKSKDGVMTRDAHAKSHGCLKSRFEVLTNELPVVHQVGLFKERRSYDAWVRFSNNDQLPIRKDNEFDLRGMAIKVLGVEGEKIMAGAEQAPTQDFLMYGSNIFFIKDNRDYISFMKGLRDDNAAFALVTSQPKGALRTLYAQFKMSGFTNPANMPFHSAVPVRLGLPTDENRAAMKYRAIPCSRKPHPTPIGKNKFNYLRDNLKVTLAKEEVCYLFQVQIQTDPQLMPVEDGTVEWPERNWGIGKNPHSPYKTVAVITIPKQDFDTPERDRYCEGLSFTPWHSLVEHKPLGRTMRMRRDLYKATADFRRQHNHTIAPEPASFEID